MNKEFLENLIEKGFTIRQIGLEALCSEGKIKHWLKKYNLKTKNKAAPKKIYIDNKILCPKHGLSTLGKNYKCNKCNVEYVQKRRDNLKIKSVEYKGNKCQKCGYNKCIGALEFHHLDPNEKDFGISSKGYTRSWEIVKKELDKCILVCSNCHREIHYNGL